MAKNANGLDTNQIAKLEQALGKTSSDYDQKCFNRLAKFLNRDPHANEIGNMQTDFGLQMMVNNNQ